MDFDGDGLTDLLTGSWPGELYLFRRNADGAFATAETIENAKGKAIQVGSATAVFAHDWDGDKDLDLLVGEIGGEVHWIVNDGTRDRPKFGAATKLSAGGKTLRAPGGDAGPVAADWNQDGLPDLIVGGGAGSVLYFRNTGTREQPVLAKGEQLIPAGNPQFDETCLGRRTKVCVVDYNGDGRLDLLVGDYGKETVKRKGLTSQQKKAKAEADEKFQQAVKQINDRLKPSDKPKPQRDPKLEQQAKVKELLNMLRLTLEQQKYSDTESREHGRVWFYPRLPAEKDGEATP